MRFTGGTYDLYTRFYSNYMGIHVDHRGIAAKAVVIILAVAAPAAAVTLIQFQGFQGAPVNVTLSSDAGASAQLESALESQGISGVDVSAYTAEEDVATVAAWQRSEMAADGWTIERETTTAISSQILFKRGSRAQNFIAYRLEENTGVVIVEGDLETVRPSYEAVQEATGVIEGEYVDPDVTGAGDVWLAPSSVTVSAGQEFSIGVHANTGTQKLAAYHFDIAYDPSILSVDKSKGRFAGDAVSGGVEAGSDGFNFVESPSTRLSLANTRDPGMVRVNGYDVSGEGPGEDLHMVIVHFTAVGSGTTTLGLGVATLVDVTVAEIGTPNGINGEVTVI